MNEPGDGFASAEATAAAAAPDMPEPGDGGPLIFERCPACGRLLSPLDEGVIAW